MYLLVHASPPPINQAERYNPVVLQHLSKLTSSLVDFCYPPICSVCESAFNNRPYWCNSCEDELTRLQFAPACDICAMPLAEHLATCPYCQGKGLRPFNRIARLGIYASPLKDLLHRVKYAGDWALGERLALRLAEQDSVAAILSNADALVPVPLFWRRHARRGFNQAEVFARVLSRKHHVPLRRAVARLRDTPTQTALHKRAHRLENLKNAFGATRPDDIKGKHVVLVDDVMTTGATLQTMAREVRRHQPADMSVIVVAIADPKGRAFEVIK